MSNVVQLDPNYGAAFYEVRGILKAMWMFEARQKAKERMLEDAFRLVLGYEPEGETTTQRFLFICQKNQQTGEDMKDTIKRMSTAMFGAFPILAGNPYAGKK